MANPAIKTITIDKAVARMINLDIPLDGIPLLDMTEAIWADAEGELEKARTNNASKENLTMLRLLVKSCEARHLLAHNLLDALEAAVKISKVKIVDGSESDPLIDVSSLSDWAEEHFCAEIAEWEIAPTPGGKRFKSWDEVGIKLYYGNKIVLFINKIRHSMSSFREIGLMGIRKNSPNKIGKILIWLARTQSTSDFPDGVSPKDISELRNALKSLTGLADDPFFPVNEKNNYIPRFKIMDDSRNADERAKKRSVHVEYEDSWNQKDTDGYDTFVDDAAGRYLRERENDYW